jgi:hypothetical protein
MPATCTACWEQNSSFSPLRSVQDRTRLCGGVIWGELACDQCCRTRLCVARARPEPGQLAWPLLLPGRISMGWWNEASHLDNRRCVRRSAAVNAAASVDALTSAYLYVYRWLADLTVRGSEQVRDGVSGGGPYALQERRWSNITIGAPLGPRITCASQGHAVSSAVRTLASKYSLLAPEDNFKWHLLQEYGPCHEVTGVEYVP